MTKRIILYVASLAVIIGLMASGSSYAWFASSTEKKQSISVSLVSNTYSANIADIEIPGQTIIVQGDNLVNVVAARIMEIAPHENSDHLQICQMD